MEAHSVELRERVVEAYESGVGGYTTVARLFDVSEASVRRWVSLKEAQGHVNPLPKGGGTPSPIRKEHIEALLSSLGDPTAGELTAHFNRSRRRTERVHVSSMKRALHRYGYVVKKNADGHWRVCALTSRPSARRS